MSRCCRRWPLTARWPTAAVFDRQSATRSAWPAPRRQSANAVVAPVFMLLRRQLDFRIGVQIFRADGKAGNLVAGILVEPAKPAGARDLADTVNLSDALSQALRQ